MDIKNLPRDIDRSAKSSLFDLLARHSLLLLAALRREARSAGAELPACWQRRGSD
jgi:hypothetical protein